MKKEIVTALGVLALTGFVLLIASADCSILLPKLEKGGKGKESASCLFAGPGPFEGVRAAIQKAENVGDALHRVAKFNPYAW